MPYTMSLERTFKRLHTYNTVCPNKYMDIMSLNLTHLRKDHKKEQDKEQDIDQQRSRFFHTI